MTLMKSAPKVIVLAGTAGTGKSSIGCYLLTHFKDNYPDIKFIEGDDLHPKENIIKMCTGHPFNDNNCWEWLKTISH